MKASFSTSQFISHLIVARLSVSKWLKALAFRPAMLQSGMSVETAPQAKAARQVTRIGSVSFLNAKPLIYGLEDADGLELKLDVPSRLLDGLRNNLFDVALLPVIDYQHMPELRLLTSGGIGCDGHTLTVRIFSPVPIEKITTLACDTDSHTSVALARILLAEVYRIRPEFIPLDRIPENPGIARLLIGDKVVCEEPANLPHQLDLGYAWKQQTGLPFVFAAWMARPDVPLNELAVQLENAKRLGLADVESIIARHAIPRGWPARTARAYLTCYLQFDIGEQHLNAIRLFHRLAHQHGLIPHPPRELDVFAAEREDDRRCD
jgi:chorismate dehydratase